MSTSFRKLFWFLYRPVRKFYRFIFHPKTFGVKCLIESNNKFLLIKNTYGIGHWTAPGGKVKKGELPELAAKRETKEEVGINLNDIEYIGYYQSNREYKRDTVYCFYKKLEKFPEIKIDPKEIKIFQWFDKNNVPEFHSPAIDEYFKLLIS